MITRHRNYKDLFLLIICILVVSLVVLTSCIAPASTSTPPAPMPTPAPAAPGKTIVVTSAAGSGPQTLRQALLDAQSGDTITFDPAIFPPSVPATFSLTSGLPDISQGSLTIDASDAGVILDGSNIGTTPVTGLLDDVSLTLDGGPNLIANGDFTAGLGHWRPWDEAPGATRSLNSSDFASSPNSYEWSSVAHAGDTSTVYDITDTSAPFDDWPYRDGTTVWMPVSGGSKAELRFWYRHGSVGATLHAMFSDGHEEGIGEWWFDGQADWTEAVASQVLPANAVAVALALHNSHPESWANGLSISSNGNTIRGLQIIHFPGPGIALVSGAQRNTIGGDRGVGAGPLGQGNLISLNGNIGVYLSDASFNTIRGNYIGTDPSGAMAWGNRLDGIYFDGASSHNQVIDNLISGNGESGIEIFGPNSLGNIITQNSIHDNDWMAIDLWDGGNTELAAPLITDFDLSVGTVTGWAGADCTVEIFSDSSNEGEVYEGQTTADSSGFFTLNKGASLTGPHLTATATDADGNTSEFSKPTSGTYKSASLQEGNNLPRTQLQPKQSNELEDNRIGIHFNDLWKLEPEVFPEGVLDASHILKQGMKRARFAINNFDSDRVHWSNPENIIDPSHDDFITSLADNGITLTYVLSFWDKEYVAQGGEVLYPRFKTEDDIQRYLDFVQFIVHHFKDRIQYYEIWNEPNIRDTVQWIEVEDYIKLVKRTIPVIRQEYPEAKIVVGGMSYLIQSDIQEYLFTILRSDDIMPLVDVISFHSMYGTSPEYDLHKQYYYNYPSLIQEIKDTASARGFTGEYVADELSWMTPECIAYPYTYYSETVAAKYYARGIMMNLGIDVIVSQFYAVPPEGHPMQIVNTIRNLATVMAGNKPIDLPIEIQSEATNIKSYSFSLSNGDKLLALWTDGVAVDNDPGIEATLTLPSFSVQRVMGIDILNGFEQQMITSLEDGNLVIRNLLVKDYPIILRLTD